MSKLAIKYEGCQDTVDNLKKVSNIEYEDLINDLSDILSSLNSLTYKPSTSGISDSISKAKENQEKLIGFANALNNYAEKLYEFDNTFYNNFVRLDGTNSDNYNKNIGTLEISDDEIEKLYIDDKNSLERYLYELMKALNEDYSSDNSIIQAIEKEIKKFSLSPENMTALKLLLRGNSFKIIKNGEDIFIQLKKSNLDSSDLEKCAKYLHDELKILNDGQLENILSGNNTRNIRKLETFVERLLSDDGAKIYDSTNDVWSRYANKILKGEFGDLNKYIERADIGLWDYFKKAPSEAFVEDILGEAKYIKNNFSGFVDSLKSGDIIDDISNSTKSAKWEFAGKAFGVVDKVTTVWSNANEDLKDENGNWTLANGEEDKKFVVDNVVDLGTSATAAAAGAEAGAVIGSVIPGAGTVAGAVIGSGIAIGINYKFIGDPPKSIVDETKDIANKAADKIGNCIGKIFW